MSSISVETCRNKKKPISLRQSSYRLVTVVSWSTSQLHNVEGGLDAITSRESAEIKVRLGVQTATLQVWRHQTNAKTILVKTLVIGISSKTPFTPIPSPPERDQCQA